MSWGLSSFVEALLSVLVWCVTKGEAHGDAL